MIENYTEPRLSRDKKSINVKSKNCKDKLICHIIVLLLIIKEFEIDSNDLVHQLKLEPKSITHYLREVNCVKKIVEGKKSETEWKLKAPMKII